MDESTGQLLSTRINNLAGEAAGHNNETAHNEITFDNPTDVNASDVKMLISEIIARLLYLIMVRELRTSGIY